LIGLGFAAGLGVGTGEREDGGERDVFFNVAAAAGGNHVRHLTRSIDGKDQERAAPALNTDTLTNRGETHGPILWA
jgi:hypothetical protein